MAEYVLSNKADADLTEIYRYSYRTFGEAQADTYFLGLGTCLRSLADTPGIGRSAGIAVSNLLRHEHGEHIVFYQIEDGGIFVVRVLHRRMFT